MHRGHSSSWVAGWLAGALLLSTVASYGQSGAGGIDPAVYDDPSQLLLLINANMAQKRYSVAVPAAERLLQIAEKRSGPRHADTAFTLDILAMLYRDQGQLERAEPLFQRAYGIYEAIAPGGAKSNEPLLNLGRIAAARGDTARALSMYRQALQNQERATGSNDPAMLPVLRHLQGLFVDQKNYAAAEPWYVQDLAIVRESQGEQSAPAAEGWARLANLYYAEGDYARGVPAAERELAIREQLSSAGDPALLPKLNALGDACARLGDLSRAARYRERVVTILDAAQPVDPGALSLALNRLGMVYERALDYARAETAFRRALINLELVTPRDESEIAIAVSNLAHTALSRGDRAQAEALLARNVDIRARAGSPRELAGALIDLARVHTDLGKFEAAEPEFLRARDVLTQASQLQSQEGGDVLDGLGTLYTDRGDYARAQPLYEQAVAIAERVDGPHSSNFASALNNLGLVYTLRGDFARAEASHQRAHDLFVELYGPVHGQVATALNNLGSLWKGKGDYGKAERFFARALEIDLQTHAPPVAVANIRTNLGWVALNRGDYAQAEQYYQRALADFQSAFGPNHPKVALALNNLGTFYEKKGDGARAEPLFRQALAILGKQPESPDTAASLLNLASSYDRRNDFERAEPLCRQALALFERTLGPNHPMLALALNQLASLRQGRGDLAEAEALLRRALGIASQVEGSSDVARYQGSLAEVLAEQGKNAEAQPLFEAALEGFQRAFGADHPDVAKLLVGRGVAYWAMGDAAHAVAAVARSSDMRERQVAHVLSTGSEEQRRLFLDVSSFEAVAAVSLNTSGFPDDPAARRLALLEILRRKGRVLDAMSDTTRALREHLSPADRPLFERLRALRSELARLTLAGSASGQSASDWQQALSKLQRDAEQAEAQISSRSEAFRAVAQPVTLERVSQELRPGAALLEISSFYPFDPKQREARRAWGVPHYAAYVLRADGRVAFADLGERAGIDHLASQFRRALDDAKRDARAPGRALFARVMAPVLPLLGGVKEFVLAPDGELALIPFGALVDDKDRYLIDTWSFSYVSSGRDLLRPPGVAARSAPLVVANPAFSGAGAGPAGVASKATRSSQLSDAEFEPLPGTEAEGRAVASSLRGASFLSGEAATRAAIAQLKGPRVLHIATHGFFLGSEPTVAPATRGFVLGESRTPAPAPLPVNPLLRSGLAFSGANQHRADDLGILTALEASSLDLWGTRLVVLSACETGVGEVKNGEGVYGLRRALVLAGAESLVMSLWKVSDAATRDLMIAYYERLKNGEGRAEALRSAQRSLKQRSGYAHPFYWASFVAYGDATPLGAEVELPPALAGGALSAPPSATPLGAARGCGCRTAGESGDGAMLMLLALLPSVLARRARRVTPTRCSCKLGVDEFN